MEKQSRVFNNAYNRLLDAVTAMGVDGNVQSETKLSALLSVSRTTVRFALGRLDEQGIIRWDKSRKVVLRLPSPADYFPAEEAMPMQAKIELAFSDYVSSLPPGTALNESQMAAAFQVSTSALREFLIRFSRFGLISKEPNRRWVLTGVTQRFVDDLFFIREMLEMRAIARVMEHWKSTTTQRDYKLLAERHRAVLAETPNNPLSFRALDEQFHRRLLGELESRIVDGFLDLLTTVCFKQYLWRRVDEVERNAAAIDEHLAIIEAILRGDKQAAQTAMLQHLRTGRETLLNSTTR